jgi:hypothetical protein
MEAARERCCDVKQRTDGGRRASMWVFPQRKKKREGINVVV